MFSLFRKRLPSAIQLARELFGVRLQERLEPLLPLVTYLSSTRSHLDFTIKPNHYNELIYPYHSYAGVEINNVKVNQYKQIDLDKVVDLFIEAMEYYSFGFPYYNYRRWWELTFEVGVPALGWPERRIDTELMIQFLLAKDYTKVIQVLQRCDLTDVSKVELILKIENDKATEEYVFDLRNTTLEDIKQYLLSEKETKQWKWLWFSGKVKLIWR